MIRAAPMPPAPLVLVFAKISDYPKTSAGPLTGLEASPHQAQHAGLLFGDCSVYGPARRSSHSSTRPPLRTSGSQDVPRDARESARQPPLAVAGEGVVWTGKKFPLPALQRLRVDAQLSGRDGGGHSSLLGQAESLELELVGESTTLLSHRTPPCRLECQLNLDPISPRGGRGATDT